MLVTEKKPINEILEFMKNDKNIFLVACNGCPEACETGGKKEVLKLRKELENAGKTIVGRVLIDFLCNKVLVTLRFSKHIEKIKKADSILVVSCGIGVQAVSNIIDKVVYPALNTKSLGGFQGLWPASERCEECGDCYLDLTGGICPITFCTKSLLNGPCGGTKDGKCEIDAEKDCGWHLIYERLKKTGNLDKMKKKRKSRDHKKMLPSADLQKTHFYDIEK